MSKMPKPPGARSEDSNESVELSVANEQAFVKPVEPVIPRATANRKIKVTATRNGFIHNVRRSPGDKFECTERELGDWMVCEDPVEQKKHLQRTEERRRSANAKGYEEDRRELASE